jgi:hypothetical protein
VTYIQKSSDLFVLNNGRLQTKPVVMSSRFMFAMFNTIEADYADKEQKYRFRQYLGSKVGRLKNHLTKADLQLATTVQVCFNVSAKLESNTKHRIYGKLQELFEKEAACSKDQFYAAFDKFVQHGLIEVHKDEIDGTEHYTLNHYNEPDTGVIGRFAMLHPVVFTKSFASMPLARQKLYYYAQTKQGENDHEMQWNLKDGLSEFVHRTQANQIRAILEALTSEKIYNGHALFTVGDIKKNVIGGFKAVFKVNPEFIIKYIPGDGEFHEVLPAKTGYSLLAIYNK